MSAVFTLYKFTQTKNDKKKLALFDVTYNQTTNG